MEIYDKNALISLSGLENLISVGFDLEIYDNNALISLSGLESLTSVGEEDWSGGKLNIFANNTLTILGLENLCSIKGDFKIYENPNLCNSLAKDLNTQVENYPDCGIGGKIDIQDNKDCD